MTNRTRFDRQFRIPFQSICRTDLIGPEVGLTEEEASALTDEQMKQIAGKMGNATINESWWFALKEATKAIR